jgi:hypothetical protein
MIGIVMWLAIFAAIYYACPLIDRALCWVDAWFMCRSSFRIDGPYHRYDDQDKD